MLYPMGKERLQWSVKELSRSMMIDEPKPTDDPLKLAEDKGLAYYNAWSPLEVEVFVKVWRANNPRNGSSIDELNRQIRKLLK